MLTELIHKVFVKAISPILHRPMIIGAFNYTPFEEIFRKAMDFVWNNRLEGDYLEFGVYQGKSFAAAFRFAKLFGLKSMKFYAFDSFQGLPKISGVDAEGFQHYHESELSCGLAEFKKNICGRGVDPRRVVIIPGWYNKVLNEETKKKLQIKKAAIIMVDCDLYASTISVLNFITDYLQAGTIIMFHDWFSYRADPNRGEQKAFREWLKKNPQITARQYQKYALYGNSFIITVNSQ